MLREENGPTSNPFIRTLVILMNNLPFMTYFSAPPLTNYIGHSSFAYEFWGYIHSIADSISDVFLMIGDCKL